jgi:pyruvate dehydrogenase E1 component beta subunit
MKRLTFQGAVIEAIKEEMARDERVFHLGQDIGPFGGTMQSTKGLWEEFGPSGRIIDAPMSESAMVGACVGAAMMGMRPIVQIMYAEFLPLVMHHIVHDAAGAWYYTAGQARVPLVLRTLFGIGVQQAHPHNFESWFIHVPGLKVVMPATPYDAKGLLKSAIRDENPVLFFEHKYLFHGMRGDIPEEEFLIPLGVADVKREGRDVTVVATGLMVHRALNVANALSKEGINVEVLDLRTIAPLDQEAILSSVKKTGRLVVVHESWKIGGIGGEVAGLVAEKAFRDLKSPIVRVGASHVPLPHTASLAAMVVPDEERITSAIREVLVN